MDKSPTLGGPKSEGKRPRSGRKGEPPPTWQKALGDRVASAQKKAAEWWRALGEYRQLQHALDEKRAQLIQRGVVRAGHVPALFESSDDVPPAIRAAAEHILRTFRGLVLYSPEITHEQLSLAVAYALCTTWTQAAEQLKAAIVAPHLYPAHLARAEVWRMRWSANEPGLADVERLAPDETHPVLLEPLYRDPVAVLPDVDMPVLLVPCSRHMTDEQIDECYRRAKAEAAKLQGATDSSAIRRRPGSPKSYFAMVNHYQKWLDEGRPRTGDEPTVSNITRYGKTLLKEAIAWLDPSDPSEITPD